MAAGLRERLDRLRQRPWFRVLLVTLVVREVFAAWTGHPYDFEIWIRDGWVVNSGHNPYIGLWPPIQPPLFPQALSINAAPGYTSLPSAAYLPFWDLLVGGFFHGYVALGIHDRFVLYFLLKQPPIWGDVAAGFLLFRLTAQWTGDESKAKRLLWVWALFPYDILISAIWGQFDSLVLCLLLAMLWVRQAGSRTILEGVGIFVKWLTVIFLPLEVLRNKGWKRLWPLLAVAIPIGLSVLTFWAMHWKLSAIVATTTSQSKGSSGGLSYTRLLTLDSVVTPIQQAVPQFYLVAAYVWVGAVVLAAWWAVRRLTLDTPRGDLTAMMVIVAAFLLTRFSSNEQYMLYLFPLILLDLAAFHPDRRALFSTLLGLCLAYLVLNNTFGFWFLSPSNPQLFVIADRLNHGQVAGFEWFHSLRANILNVLAVLISVTLVQFIVTLVKDEAKPRPWLLRWISWIQRAWAGRTRVPPPPATST